MTDDVDMADQLVRFTPTGRAALHGEPEETLAPRTAGAPMLGWRSVLGDLRPSRHTRVSR
ncbi:MAG: hypothetical protein DI536_30450 [Archangium gephyra]|uniref:Uncharacterized protein n=1 Tax=Archangium gephyra TaxID=48 RepID=A0A2W5T0M9_9BACT|nr:MAG: hypothetical protein DI536_30450 [Archangium gephyra]